MSHARLSIWLNRAIADYLTPEQKETVMAEFLRQASNDAGGHRVYIPVVARADYELVMTMDALQREGKSLRQIARLFRLSHETVRAKLSKIPSYSLDSKNETMRQPTTEGAFDERALRHKTSPDDRAVGED